MKQKEEIMEGIKKLKFWKFCMNKDPDIHMRTSFHTSIQQNPIKTDR